MKFVRLAAPAALMLAAALAAPAWAEKKVVPPEKPEHGYLHEGHPEGASSAYIWLDICLEASARDVEKYGARPTILSRQMAIWATAAFDAWDTPMTKRRSAPGSAENCAARRRNTRWRTRRRRSAMRAITRSSLPCPMR
ncbi:MAG: hypothetical protein R3F11_07150 [Verrucomicrobiales bacterium]